MKSPIMLACAMVLAMSVSSFAQQQAAAAPAAENAQVKGGKGQGAKMTPEQREAMVNKRLETIKAKDEALYKELVDLKEKDPKAFRDKMRELAQAHGKAQREAKGQGQGKGKGKNKPE